MTTATDTILRPAGLLECYHTIRHYLGHDSCLVAAAHYSSKDGQPLTESALFIALRTVILQHAALRIRPVDESSGRPAFKRLRKLNFREVVQFSKLNGTGLAKVIEEQFLQPFPTDVDLPLWRLLVLKDNTIVFSWHHGIGDGQSGLAFHRALLSALCEIEDDPVIDDLESIDLPTEAELTPPIETVTNVSPSFRKIFQGFYDLLAPTSWTRGSSAWTGNSVHTEADLATRAEIIDFSPQESTDFLKLCRANNATLTSTFHSLATSVLSQMLTSSTSTSNPRPKTICTCIPISLRAVANTSPDVFCDHVSAYHSYPPIDSVFSWDMAAKYASILRIQAKTSGDEVGMIKYLFGRYEAYFKGKLGGKRTDGLEISNLGRFDPGRNTASPRWKIGRTCFAQCDAVLGAAIKMNVVGAPTGGVTVAVTWSTHAIDTHFVETLIVAFKEAYYGILQRRSGQSQ